MKNRLRLTGRAITRLREVVLHHGQYRRCQKVDAQELNLSDCIPEVYLDLQLSHDHAQKTGESVKVFRVNRSPRQIGLWTGACLTAPIPGQYQYQNWWAGEVRVASSPPSTTGKPSAVGSGDTSAFAGLDTRVMSSPVCSMFL